MAPLATLLEQALASRPNAAAMAGGNAFEDAESRAGLERLLASALAEGRAAWPTFRVSDAAFVAYLAQHLPDAGLEAAIEALLPVDLYLAVACVGGNAEAIQVLDKMLLQPAAAEAARSYRGGLEAAELLQAVREKVLVRQPTNEPKLATYAGRAPLSSWVRVVAIHAAVSASRRLRPTETLDEVSEGLAEVVAADVELGHLETRYASEFKAAFHDAIARLDERDRTMLRMHVLDHLGIDELCKIHGVHRATAARWLVRIREALFEWTKESLRIRLSLDEEEFEGIVHALLSRLDVSLERALTA